MRCIDRGIVAAATALVVGLGGTAAGQPDSTPSEHPEVQCPDVLRGVKLSLEPTSQGVVFEFTTPRSEYVARLRVLLREAGEVVEQHSQMMAAQDVMTDPDALEIPPVAVTVTNVKSGARVIIRAQNTRDLLELRKHARGFEEFWSASECVNGGPRV
jgi:hypothetical protein